VPATLPAPAYAALLDRVDVFVSGDTGALPEHHLPKQAPQDLPNPRCFEGCSPLSVADAVLARLGQIEAIGTSHPMRITA